MLHIRKINSISFLKFKSSRTPVLKVLYFFMFYFKTFLINRLVEDGGWSGGVHGNPHQYSCLENLHGWRSLTA